jgi:hypothetical protein
MLVTAATCCWAQEEKRPNQLTTEKEITFASIKTINHNSEDESESVEELKTDRQKNYSTNQVISEFFIEEEGLHRIKIRINRNHFIR